MSQVGLKIFCLEQRVPDLMSSVETKYQGEFMISMKALGITGQFLQDCYDTDLIIFSFYYFIKFRYSIHAIFNFEFDCSLLIGLEAIN